MWHLHCALGPSQQRPQRRSRGSHVGPQLLVILTLGELAGGPRPAFRGLAGMSYNCCFSSPWGKTAKQGNVDVSFLKATHHQLSHAGVVSKCKHVCLGGGAPGRGALWWRLTCGHGYCLDFRLCALTDASQPKLGQRIERMNRSCLSSKLCSKPSVSEPHA